MRIAIHQPNFLPWMGYFYKMAQCDTFVLLDHVEFTKKSFTKRVKIHKPHNLEEEQYLTVPLQRHSDFTAINKLKLVEDERWQKKIFAQVQNSYHKAPFYPQIEPLMERFFQQPRTSNSFAHFTSEVIKYIAELLNLQPKYTHSSELDLSFSGPDVNLDIVSFLNGQTYISGMGAKKYQNEKLFTESGIHLQYSDFKLHFETMDIPRHFLNKSVLSYLAHFDLHELQSKLK